MDIFVILPNQLFYTSYALSCMMYSDFVYIFEEPKMLGSSVKRKFVLASMYSYYDLLCRTFANIANHPEVVVPNADAKPIKVPKVIYVEYDNVNHTLFEKSTKKVVKKTTNFMDYLSNIRMRVNMFRSAEETRRRFFGIPIKYYESPNFLCSRDYIVYNKKLITAVRLYKKLAKLYVGIEEVKNTGEENRENGSEIDKYWYDKVSQKHPDLADVPATYCCTHLSAQQTLMKLDMSVTPYLTNGLLTVLQIIDRYKKVGELDGGSELDSGGEVMDGREFGGEVGDKLMDNELMSYVLGCREYARVLYMRGNLRHFVIHDYFKLCGKLDENVKKCDPIIDGLFEQVKTGWLGQADRKLLIWWMFINRVALSEITNFFIENLVCISDYEIVYEVVTCTGSNGSAFSLPVYKQMQELHPGIDIEQQFNTLREEFAKKYEIALKKLKSGL